MTVNTVTIRGDHNVTLDAMEMRLSGDIYDDTITWLGSTIGSGNPYAQNSPFSYQAGITKITLPNLDNTITGAFRDCTSLKEVDFPVYKPRGNNSGSYNNATFKNCVNLERVNMPSMTYSGYMMFMDCAKLTENCGIPFDKITNIREYSFKNCVSLVNMELPELTGISTEAFMGCSSLRRFYAKVISMSGSNVFGGCNALEIIRIPSNTSELTTSLFSNGQSTGLENLKLVDFGVPTSIGSSSNPWAIAYVMSWAKIVIIRTTSLVSLVRTSDFNSTKSPTPIQFYVPSNLVSDYENATNWSTLLANGLAEFRALEGSRFEDPEFDDTDIYNADRDSVDELL